MSYSRWRPHPWHGLDAGRDLPLFVNAYVEITPFDVIKYERNLLDNRESKVYVSKRIGPEVLTTHLSERTVTQAV